MGKGWTLRRSLQKFAEFSNYLARFVALQKITRSTYYTLSSSYIITSGAFLVGGKI